MKETMLKGQISRWGVCKGVFLYFFASRVFLATLAYCIVALSILAYIFFGASSSTFMVSKLEWHHILVFFVILLSVAILMQIWSMLMTTSQMKAYNRPMEIRIFETGISQSLPSGVLERKTTILWSGVQRILKAGPLIIVYTKSGRALTIFSTFFESQAQKEDTLNLLRQKAEEYLIATRGF